jgi:hypothetical protein
MLLSTGMAMHAQTVQWLKTQTIETSVNGQTTGYTNACDPSGNIYMSGFKENSFNYNDLMGDVSYSKYNADGELLFTKTFTGNVSSYIMAPDAQGNIIIALAYFNDLVINDVTYPHAGFDVDHAIVKLDSEGNVLWHKRLVIDGFGIDYVGECRAVATDADGNIYAGYDNFMYSYITKYSADGTALFTIEQQNASALTSIAVDTEGNIYGAGSCAGANSSYAGVAAPTEFGYNTYLVKYSPEGSYQWVKYIEDITCPSPQVAVRTPDEVYMSSYLFTSNNFDDIAIEGPENMFDDIFIAKLNAAGTFQWVREVEGPGHAGIGNRNFLTVDGQGNVYCTGTTSGTTNWDSDTTTVSGLDTDALLLKYNPQGDLLIAKNMGGDGYDRIDAISINSAGDIYISGMVNDSGDFDGIEYDAGQFDFIPYLAKITTGTLGTHTADVTKPALYPNPSSGFIRIRGIRNPVKGQIINALGQKVKDFEAGEDTAVNVMDLPQGTYIIMLEELTSLKFIKN